MKSFTTWMNENRRQGMNNRQCRGLVLADGTTMSVQASSSHYCSPRVDLGSYSLYDEFEIGFPSVMINEIMPWVEDEERPTDTVYAYVPKTVIEQLILARGGVVGVTE